MTSMNAILIINSDEETLSVFKGSLLWAIIRSIFETNPENVIGTCITQAICAYHSIDEILYVAD